MADEYYERYKHLSHQELYRMLQAGSANQVDTIADSWASIGDTVSAISATLQQDLKRLLPDWTSQGSREFHYRLDLIARYAQTLADEASAMRTGLTVMASSLRETQRRAEPPSALHDASFAAGHLIDGVVGTNLGRVLPAAEKAQAHERMVRLIARLAAHYGVADHRTWPVMVPEPPIDLPASGVTIGLAAGIGLVAGSPRHHGHGHDRDRDRERERDRDRDRDRDGRHGHGRGHGERSGSSAHTHLGSLGAAVIGGASGWAQYGRPVHLAGHSIGVELSAGGGHYSAAVGGSGGTGSSGGSGGSGGTGSGGSSSGGSGRTSGSAGGPSGSTGSGSAGMSGTSGGAVGAGGAGTAMPMAPMGGVAPAAGVTGGGAAGPGLGGGGSVGSADRAWHAPDPVGWADPDDDAAPSVLGD